MSTRSQHIRALIVDDDPRFRRAMRRALVLLGVDVDEAAGGDEALRTLVGHTDHDVVLLDVDMPGTGGIEVCRRIRSAGDDVAIIMVTGHTEVPDRILGLEAGADDYVPKTVDPAELVARMRASIRRMRTITTMADNSAVLHFADLQLDTGTMEVRRGDAAPLPLSRTEFELLDLLLRNPRQVLPRDLIYERVWGADISTTSNSLEVFVSILRRKTEDGGRPRLIQTMRGVGYMLREATR